MAVSSSGLLALISMAEASPQGLRACTQRYATWINLCDTTLRGSSNPAGIDQSSGQWCASSPKVIETLKRQLFSIDALCTDVTPEERQGLVKLVAPTLRSLNAASNCAPQSSSTEVRAQTSVPQAPPKAQPSPPGASSAPPSVPRVAAQASPPPPSQVRPQPAVTETALKTPPVREREKPPPPPLPKVTTASVPAEASRPAAPAPPKMPVTGAGVRTESARLANSDPERGARLPVAALPVAGTVKVTQTARQDGPALGDCLIVRQVRPGSYVIDVSACGSKAVHAAIDLYQPNRGSHCVRRIFKENVEFGGADMPVPQINFQCVAGSAGCSAEILADMFPECQSG